MSRRKVKNKNVRSLLRLTGGTSYGVSLPMEDIAELGWKAKQKLVVKRYGKGFLIRDGNRRRGRGAGLFVAIAPHGPELGMPYR